MKKSMFWCLGALLIILLIFTVGCSGGKSSSKNQEPADDTILKLGTCPGPHAEIADNVAKLAAKQGIRIQVVEFSDFLIPNVALNDKQIFANAYQTKPYLDATLVKNPNFKLVKCFNYGFFPMAIYSHKIKKLDEIKEGMTVAVPNDPANGGRGILLLAANGIIAVKDKNDLNTNMADITANPKHLKIIELEAATMPKSLDDVDLAAINAPYAIAAGLNPSKDAIVVEAVDSMSDNPNICFLATREENAHDPRVAKLKELYQSPENKQFILDRYQEAIVPCFK